MSKKSPEKKKRDRHVRKNRNLAIVKVIDEVTRDSLMTLQEMTGETNKEESKDIEQDEEGRLRIKKDPLIFEKAVVVDTLNGHYVFSGERLQRHVDTIKLVLQEFEEKYWDTNDGVSLTSLRAHDGKPWAHDQTIIHLCYVAVAMGLAVWPYTRKEWAVLKDGLPHIKFICEKRNRSIEGTQDEKH